MNFVLCGARECLAFATMTMPNMPRGMDMSTMFRPETFRPSLSSLNNTGRVSNSQVDQVLNSVKVSGATLGGLRGVSIRPETQVCVYRLVQVVRSSWLDVVTKCT
jgi:hypothetical protein